MTEQQVRDRVKLVTRRTGWKNARVGERLQLVRKSQGLKKGETVVRVAVVEIVDVQFEPLAFIDQDDCNLEGFPELTPEQFVAMFCKINRGCRPETVVTRIGWRYVD